VGGQITLRRGGGRWEGGEWREKGGAIKVVIDVDGAKSEIKIEKICDTGLWGSTRNYPRVLFATSKRGGRVVSCDSTHASSPLLSACLPCFTRTHFLHRQGSTCCNQYQNSVPAPAIMAGQTSGPINTRISREGSDENLDKKVSLMERLLLSMELIRVDQ